MADKNEKKQFSRRHETPAEHQLAQMLYRERREAQRAAIVARAEARAKRDPEAQLIELDRRLGRGKGARKERQRIFAELLGQAKKAA